MAITWTEDQNKAITLRDRNLLVSAAAGSGKTAVLAERIARAVTDPDHPLSVDRILVVTFTHAAAAQMRERVTEALRERLHQDPDNALLRRQLTLVRQAKITTIDSFCLSVIREQYAKIGLDPSFRVADEGEIRLIREDVLQALMERKLQEKDPGFLYFYETCNPGRDDARAERLVLGLYDLAEANPWPEEWIAQCQAQYEAEKSEQIFAFGWMQKLCERTALLLRESAAAEERLAQTAGQEGLTGLAAVLSGEAAQIRESAGQTGYVPMQAAIRKISFGRKPAMKKDHPGAAAAAALWEARGNLKKQVEQIRDDYFSADPDEMLRLHQLAGQAALPLTDLTLEYMRDFTAEKRRRGILDFGDVEHLALEILTVRENGAAVPTETAREYARRFDEIMIDEYQDSNYVQEQILTAVSGEPEGHPNRFMVGDVKQSIYRFRLARPEIFMEKYASYSAEDRLYTKVELRQNFRSRTEVVTAVNFLFFRMMQEKLGGVEYTEDSALYPGASYPETAPEQTGRAGGPARLILLDTGDAPAAEEPVDSVGGSGAFGPRPASDGADDASGYQAAFDGESGTTGPQAASGPADGISGVPEGDAPARKTDRQLEAALAALEIRRITDPATGSLVRGKDGTLRPAEYGDIVILLRTMTGWADDYTAVLKEYGIPAVADSGTGYFTAPEVRTAISMLKIISNPVQDLPLGAVLLSPVGGFTAEELAEIHLAAPEENTDGLFGALKAYAAQEWSGAAGPAKKPAAQTGSSADRHAAESAVLPDGRAGTAGSGKPSADPELSGRVSAFLDRLNHFRRKAGILPLHEFMDHLLTETGYADYVASLPGSRRRTANLAMLRKRAEEFESTSYSGVFEFVRYLERLNRYEIDFPEAAEAGTDHAVHIMSIHKSKGLEFPIVILAGAGKMFNRQDSRASVVLHPDWGVGMDAVDLASRTRFPGLMKKALAQDLGLENLGEELRVLYVAMTRAKEQLVITGARRKLWDWLRLKYKQADPQADRLNFRELGGASCYLDWIIPALAGNQCMKEVWKQAGVDLKAPGGSFRAESGFAVETVDSGQILTAGEARGLDRAFLREEIRRAAASPAETAADRLAAERLSEDSHYDDMYRMPSSLSVSEIRQETADAERAAEPFSLTAEIGPAWPSSGEKLPGVSDSGERRSDASDSGKAMPGVMDSDREKSGKADSDPTITGKRPAFLQPEGPVQGAERGTLYHYLLAHLTPESGKPLEEQMQELKNRGLLSDREIAAVRCADLEAFYQSDLGRRSRGAAQKGQLHTEYPFCLGLPAGEVFTGQKDRKPLRMDPDALVEVHGIIDAWFMEGDSVILYDYKTDHIGGPGWEERLAEHYRVQLSLYARALTAMTGRKVTECYLYSIAGRKAIRIMV